MLKDQKTRLSEPRPKNRKTRMNEPRPKDCKTRVSVSLNIKCLYSGLICATVEPPARKGKGKGRAGTNSSGGTCKDILKLAWLSSSTANGGAGETEKVPGALAGGPAETDGGAAVAGGALNMAATMAAAMQFRLSLTDDDAQTGPPAKKQKSNCRSITFVLC